MGARTVVLVAVLVVAACGASDDDGVAAPVAAASESPPATATSATRAESTTTVEPQAEPTATAALRPEPTVPLVLDDLYPEVVGVRVSHLGDQSWRFDVTMTSEYDSPTRYADAWRVVDADDVELGIRVLTHDHASEQPFTRSVTVEVPTDVRTVFVEGRDQRNGWSGQRFEIALPAV